MPGRKPKPTHLKVLEGNPGKQKLPKGEPIPESEMPSPPEHLDDYAKEEWERLSQGLYSLGLLYQVDMAVFAAYCGAYSRWRSAEEQLNKIVHEKGALAGLIQASKNKVIAQNVLVNVSRNAAQDMVKYAVEFGLTPSARARLAIDPGRNKKSKFDGLINGGKK